MNIKLERILKEEKEGQQWYNKFWELFYNLNEDILEEFLKRKKQEYYLDELAICTAIKEYTSKMSKRELKQISIKWREYGIYLDDYGKMVIAQKNGKNIKINKISEIFDLNRKEKDILENKEKRKGKSHYKAFKLTKLLVKTQQNTEVVIVTGIIHSVSEKVKILHSWVELRKEGKIEFVVDYTMNAIIPKKYYYYLYKVKKISEINGENAIKDFEIINSQGKYNRDIREYFVDRQSFINEYF